MPGRRTLVALAATLVVLAPIGWFWSQSLVPDGLSAMDMGYADYGGGPAMAAGHAHHAKSLDEFKPAADRAADVSVRLVARKERFEIPGRGPMEGYTLNHTSPGPQITARQGELIEVTLRQRVRAGRRDSALARCRRTGCRGRSRRGHPGCGPAGADVHLPVRGGRRGHVLVPLTPVVARAGEEGPVRRTGDLTRVLRTSWPQCTPTTRSGRSTAGTANAERPVLPLCGCG